MTVPTWDMVGKERESPPESSAVQGSFLSCLVARKSNAWQRRKEERKQAVCANHVHTSSPCMQHAGGKKHVSGAAQRARLATAPQPHTCQACQPGFKCASVPATTVLASGESDASAARLRVAKKREGGWCLRIGVSPLTCEVVNKMGGCEKGRRRVSPTAPQVMAPFFTLFSFFSVPFGARRQCGWIKCIFDGRYSDSRSHQARTESL